MLARQGARPIRLLERLGVALILLAALVPRVRDFTSSFDRGFEGEQNSFFALAAINYERLGVWRVGGYPILNIDLGDRASPEHGIWGSPEHWSVYANHPPFVALLSWLGLKTTAGEDWNSAWRDGRSPTGIEPAVRLPFLLLHVAGLLVFWWALRQAWSEQRSMLALALLAACPVSVIHAKLANYENPALLFVFLSLGFYARFLRTGSRRELLALAACFAAGSSVTYAGLFFLPPFVVHAFLSRERRQAWSIAWAGTIAGLVPLAFHGWWAAESLERIGQAPSSIPERALMLLEPLIDGSHPPDEWLGLQIERLASWCTPWVLIVAGVGLALSAFVNFLPRLRRIHQVRLQDGSIHRQPNLAVPLLAGGFLYLFAFYRHTLDPQYPFLMFLAPGVAALAALALDMASPLLLRLRAGTAPLVLATCTLALLCAQRFNELRFELRGKPSDASSQTMLPLPRDTGEELRTLLPVRSFSVHPSDLGLNFAVSFYAWRSLWPIHGPEDTLPFAVAEHVGLGQAPHYLLLPNDPPVSAKAQAESLSRELTHGTEPLLRSSSWKAALLR